MSAPRFLAFDIGAESGRAVTATLDEDRLLLEEIHRFPNQPVEIAGTLHWNILAIYREVLQGIRICASRFGGAESVGIDTWGVDFGLLASDGSLLQNPVHYRDRRTAGILEEVGRRIAPVELFRRTGMSPSPIWSACQLLAMKLKGSPVLDCAATFLMIPDLLNYFLTGQKRCERTNAINTLLYDPAAGEWDDELFRVLDLPGSIMPDLAAPGTVLGELRDSVKADTGWRQGVVVAPCTHDTGAAVAAVPGRGDDWAFISSGTWSALGAPADRVNTSEAALKEGMCNELTHDGFFLCRNIMGLWLLQQARRSWQRSGHDYSYDELVGLAASAPEDGPLLDPEEFRFLAPEDMATAIAGYCRDTGQTAPERPAAMTRSILESLAHCYRRRLRQVSQILARPFRVLHVVGGGSKNSLLCQFTANATGFPVIAGPAEATVTGNLLVQALACGALASAAEVRETARRSADLKTYEPRDSAWWDERYEQYLRITAAGT